MDFLQEVAHCEDCGATFPILCREHLAVLADAITEANRP